MYFSRVAVMAPNTLGVPFVSHQPDFMIRQLERNKGVLRCDREPHRMAAVGQLLHESAVGDRRDAFGELEFLVHDIMHESQMPSWTPTSSRKGAPDSKSSFR